MFARRTKWASALCLGVLIGLGTAFGAHADAVSDWNAKAETIAVEKRMLPPPNARGMAIMHIAMFEAVNAIERRYSPYRLNLTADRGTSKEAAAAAAAHAVLVALHPDQEKALDAHLLALLQQIPASEAKAGGIALGNKAAAEILAWRANDGTKVPESYRPHTSAGVYVPTVIPVSSTYGGVIPWSMTSESQFRPGPPPPLTSATWAKDVEEIRHFGSRANSKRSAAQTDIGRFWFVTGPQAWNPIVRQLVAIKNFDIVDSARLFALVAIATDDAFIAVFEAKYHYNFWRPVTAIRDADQTGNASTPREAGWLPLGETPMHPEYPCAHCITSSAVAAVIRGVVGEDIGTLTLTSATAPGVTRRWTRLDDYVNEVSNARIWAGFHYRFSTEVGKDMGRKIGELTVATQLRPLRSQK